MHRIVSYPAVLHSIPSSFLSSPRAPLHPCISLARVHICHSSFKNVEKTMSTNNPLATFHYFHPSPHLPPQMKGKKKQTKQTIELLEHNENSKGRKALLTFCNEPIAMLWRVINNNSNKSVFSFLESPSLIMLHYVLHLGYFIIFFSWCEVVPR